MPRVKLHQRSDWRAAHGAARKHGRLVVLETTPADELPPAIPGPPGPPQRDPSGRFLAGNRVGTAQRVRAGSRGALYELEKKGDAAARAAIAFGRRYAAHRRTELAKFHGGELSACVGSTVESEGELLAAGRYWQARSIAEGSSDYARLAATLMAGARQAARDAWEIAAREAQARKAMLPSPFAPRIAGSAPRAPWSPTPTPPTPQSAPAGQPEANDVGATAGGHAATPRPAAASDPSDRGDQ